MSTDIITLTIVHNPFDRDLYAPLVVLIPDDFTEAERTRMQKHMAAINPGNGVLTIPKHSVDASFYEIKAVIVEVERSSIENQNLKKPDDREPLPHTWEHDHGGMLNARSPDQDGRPMY